MIRTLPVRRGAVAAIALGSALALAAPLRAEESLLQTNVEFSGTIAWLSTGAPAFVIAAVRNGETAFAGFGEVTGPIAAVYAPQRQESEVFFRGADGLLHYVYRGPGGAWAHDGASFRGAGRVVGGISAIFHPGRAHAEVIFAGEGDRLHHFFVADGRWQHASY